MKRRFEIELLKEVDDFLSELDEKARRRIIHNMLKVQVMNDGELFKKINAHV
ncbi:MAG: hypothetical protein WBA12_09390 [Catalinimonas sp.]